MKTFQTLVEELSSTQKAQSALKKLKVGDTVTYNHHKHGEVSGKYQGVGRMGGRTFAKVTHPDHKDESMRGTMWVPPHHIKESFEPTPPKQDLQESGNFRNIPHDAPADPRNPNTTMVYRHHLTPQKDGWVTHHVSPDGSTEQIGGKHKDYASAFTKATEHAKMHGKIPYNTLHDDTGGKDVDDIHDNNHHQLIGNTDHLAKHYDDKGHRKDSYWK